MRKIFTGNGQITPYRPWSEERRAIARARRFGPTTEDLNVLFGLSRQRLAIDVQIANLEHKIRMAEQIAAEILGTRPAG